MKQVFVFSIREGNAYHDHLPSHECFPSYEKAKEALLKYVNDEFEQELTREVKFEDSQSGNFVFKYRTGAVYPLEVVA